MPKTSNHVATVPTSGGKVWVQRMERVREFLCTTNTVFPQPNTQSASMVKTLQVLPSSYTICTHLFTTAVGKFTSVNSQLSAVYTGPITTTTTYISI